MHDFFLIKWYRTSCLGKIAAVVMGLVVLCLCGSIPVTLYSFLGNPTGVRDPSAIPSAEEETLASQWLTPTVKGPLSRDDYEIVCQGGTIADVPAYEPQPGSGKSHPAVAFLFTPDSATSSRPYTWGNDFSAIEVVGCITRIDESLRDQCYYTMKDTGEKHTVHRYDAKYKVVVYEAVSGRKLGESEIVELYTTACLPEFSSMQTSKTDHTWYAQPGEQDVDAALEPYINP